MFVPLHDRSSRSLVKQSSVEFARYQRLWAEWMKGSKTGTTTQRWGQFLSDRLNLTEEQAPGLYNASTTTEATRIFKQHFTLEN
jgi:hypothetical protein